MIVFGLILLIATTAAAETKEQKQAAARKKADDALTALYKARPSAKATIKAAAGYAAFSNFGMKILLAGGGKGQAMALNNRTKHLAGRLQ